MSKFKVGDRARLTHSSYPELVGREVVIVGIGGATQCEDCDCEIEIPGHPSPTPVGLWSAKFEYLRPITPPASDAWANAKVKQVCKPTYLEPVRTKERA